MHTNILISKEGQQLGPYTMDEARAHVLSGQILATDLAWPEGATAWVPLNQIPGFAEVLPSSAAVATTPPTGLPGAVSAAQDPFGAATQGVEPTVEREIWKGRPSQLLKLGLYVAWVFVIISLLIGATYRWEIYYAMLVLAPIGVIQCLWEFIRIRAIRYLVTTQRVRVTRGIFRKDVQELELFRVKDTATHQPFLLRIFGLGDIEIISGDSSNPSLRLSAVPNSVAMREELRQEILVLRQKFGVRELDMM